MAEYVRLICDNTEYCEHKGKSDCPFNEPRDYLTTYINYGLSCPHKLAKKIVLVRADNIDNLPDTNPNKIFQESKRTYGFE